MALVVYDPTYRVQTPIKSVLPDRMVEQLTELHASSPIPSSENRLDTPEGTYPELSRQQQQKAQKAYQQTEQLKRRQTDKPDLLVDKIMTAPVVTITSGAVEVGGVEHPGLSAEVLEKLGVGALDLERRYQLGPDEFFMAGTSDNAFDSRYYGPVSGDQLVGHARGLW